MQHPACMRAVVPTILIFRTLLVGTLVHLLPPALAQQSVSDPVYYICNGAPYATNNGFAQNLNTVATALMHNSPRALYGLASSLTGFHTDYVHGMYQCRGDVSLFACSDCVVSALTAASSTSITALCNFLSRGVRVQYQGCFVRYENYAFDAALETIYAVQPSCSTAAGAASPALQRYRQNLGIALNTSGIAAPRHALFGFNATSAGSGSTAAYALTQCLGYLNSSQCATCLSQVSNYSNACNSASAVSGQIFFVDCYYLFNNTPFVLTYSNVSVPGAASPALSPTSVITIAATERWRSNHRAAIIVGIVVGTSALILACIIAGLAFYFLKRKKAETQGEQVLLEFGARRFSLKELHDATNNFHPTKMLGAGGFGPVYQGRLESGREVAIKMLSSQSHQGESEFVNEVRLIITVQHRNLIQLIGFCMEHSRPLLVYEYLPKRSLDLCLFGANENNALDWRTRFEIIVGIARGLRYLHDESPVRIIHRDIKASNILLDNNFNPKIADFGLARLFPDDTSHLTTRVVGTLGYLAPEYAIRGQLTEKVDVYSFGLLALETVSGRKAVETAFESDKENLLDWTWASYEKQQLLQIVDGRMHANAGEVIRVVHVALLCTQLQPEARPSMSEVHDMLRGQSGILNLPTKPMTVGMLELLHEVASSSSTPEPSVQLNLSYDVSSISQVEPR